MKLALPVLTALLLLLKADPHPSVRIICYHTFRDAKKTYDFSMEELREQIEFLKSRGFSFIGVQDLASGRVKGDRNILITIDDGNVSVYRAYKEVFRPLGIRPLLAIYPNVIGKKSYALTWEQLAELVRDGCDVAAHGYYHSILSSKNYEKDRKSFTREITLSKKMLEEKLGKRVDYFVYPFGAYSDQAQDLVRESGYKLAFTIKPGAVATPVNGNRFTVSRYMLTRETVKWQMHKIAGALPNNKQGPAEKASPVLVAKTVKDAGKEKLAVVNTGKDKGKKETAAAEARPDIRKKAKEPIETEHKGEKARKKHRKGSEGKEIADVRPVAESVKTPAAADRKDAAELFYPAITPVEPASGDVIIEDAYAAVGPHVKAQPASVPVSAGRTANPDRTKLRKEYLSLAADSYQNYAVMIDQLRGKIQELRRTVERLVMR